MVMLHSSGGPPSSGGVTDAGGTPILTPSGFYTVPSTYSDASGTATPIGQPQQGGGAGNSTVDEALGFFELGSGNILIGVGVVVLILVLAWMFL